MADGVGAAAPLQAPSVPQAAPTGPAQAENEKSALLTARLQDRRIEVLDSRSETSTSWAYPDGSLKIEQAAGPVRVKQGDSWTAVDLDLQRRADGGVEPGAHPRGLVLAGTASDRKQGRLATLLDERRKVELTWPGALPVPDLQGARATYREVKPGVDLVVEATRTGVEDYLVVRNRKAARDLDAVRMTVATEGLKVQEQDDGTHLLTGKGGTLGLIGAATGWDADIDEKSKEPTDRAELDVSSTVSADGSDVAVTYALDDTYINDADTTFPVTVDPGISLRPSLDTFVEQGYTHDQAGATELKIGNNGSNQVARSFLAFPTASLRGRNILEAELRLFNHHSWTCEPAEWEVWDTGAPTHATRWGAQPKFNKKIATSTVTKGGEARCPGGWTGVKITDLVSGWASKGPATAGIGLRASNESDPKGWKRFNSAEGKHPPTLAVTLTPGLQAPTQLQASPGRNTIGRRWVASLTPELSGTVTSGNGAKLDKVAFELADRNDKILLTQEQDGVPSGHEARFKVPADKLKDGGTYSFRMRARDGHGWSAWSPRYTFHAYTNPPPAPKVSSANFPKNAWGGKLDEHGRYAGKVSVTSDTYAVSYRVDDGAWQEKAVAPNETAALALAVPGGKHTLQVRGIGRAGLPSTTVRYPFYAGPGAALLTPGAGERTARRVALHALGRTEHTKVEYQYRLSSAGAWTTIPVEHVRTTGGGRVSWPVDAPKGQPQPLVWNVADTLSDDTPVQVRAHFTGGRATYSDPHRILLDREAGTAPQPELGPGTVNLLTGAFSHTATDASAWGIDVQRTAVSRRHVTPAQMGLAPIHGPGWAPSFTVEDTDAAFVSVRKTSGSSLHVTYADGHGIGFSRTGSGWQPEVGSEDLTLTGSESAGFTLTDTAGIKTTFKKPSPKVAAWLVVSTELPMKNSTTHTVYETVTSGKHILARPSRIVAPTSAVSAATCAKTPSTRGCRVLDYTYATHTTATHTPGDIGDVKGQVKRINLWSTDAGAAKATSTPVATFAYGISGRLYEAWDPRLDKPLKTIYRYDRAQRITQIIPPAEEPYSFAYGRVGDASTSGDGMLLSVSRATLKPGSVSETNGTAAASLVYNVPLTGAKAPYAMGAQDVATWGQSDAPTDAAAVFPPDVQPSSHDGSELTRGEYSRAVLAYINASGRQTNSANSTNNITTNEYDRYGNVVRSLTAANRLLALAATQEDKDTLLEHGLDPETTTSAERAHKLSTQSNYSADGLRENETRGPQHLIKLPSAFRSAGQDVIDAGALITARDLTRRSFDQGRPASATLVKDLPTTQTSGVEPAGYPGELAEPETTTTTYDWSTGLITKTVDDPAGLALTHTTAYNGNGLPIESTMPKSGGADAGTVLTEYYTATGSGTCANRPEWADLPCRTRHAAAADAGTNRQLPDVTSQYDRYGNTVKATETANGATRTTTNSYDPAERLRTSALTSSVGTAIGTRTYAYDPSTGRATSATADGKELRTAYDRLGRIASYTDASGATTTTSYDALDRPTKVSDTSPSTTTYAYDAAQEPRGLATSATTDNFGTIKGRYDADGDLIQQTLPGNITARDEFDPAGYTTTRRYQRSDGEPITAEDTLPGPHSQRAENTSSTDGVREWSYDRVGRLTRSDHTPFTASCTRQSFSFDGNGNRLTKGTADGDSDACTDASTKIERHTYDSADRLTDAGYNYDAFGNTTTQPDGITNSYFADNFIRSQQTNTQRTTWESDPSSRRVQATSQTKQTNGTWGGDSTQIFHFSTADDSPTWSTDKATGTKTRYIAGLDGSFIATQQGSTHELNLPDLHGDTTVVLDRNNTAHVRTFDDFGLPGTDQKPVAYGWLGANRRSAETPTGDILMGARLYAPSIGRFLQTDPIPSGSANAYDYANQDPVNTTDLSGTCFWDACIGEITIGIALAGALAGAAAYEQQHPIHLNLHFGGDGGSSHHHSTHGSVLGLGATHGLASAIKHQAAHVKAQIAHNSAAHHTASHHVALRGEKKAKVWTHQGRADGKVGHRSGKKGSKQRSSQKHQGGDRHGGGKKRGHNGWKQNPNKKHR
ncbi:RHS repeat protein [Streptomyces triticagri]|uniref:RHS repeat protein n=2 Tax=Streptomyces triticagri TaxID=2293568 RepID=A0A372MCQ2_9ACTN|nr:RHS repeat protein [Streptomyces triticagri]